MKTRYITISILLILVMFLSGCMSIKKQMKEPKEGDTVAEIIVKDLGSIKIKLFTKEMPKTCENFITHANNGYYDNILFHRVIEGDFIQTGDPEGTGRGGKSIWGGTFDDEINMKTNHFRGAVSMANSGPNTNGSQFFIVQSDYASKNENFKKLDKKTQEAFQKYGGLPNLNNKHTIFGQVYDGFDIVDKIANSKTNSKDKPYPDIMVETIVIIEY